MTDRSRSLSNASKNDSHTPTPSPTQLRVGKGNKRRYSSPVWDYISVELENNQATRKCLKCNHKFSVNSSTSTLTNHLRKHGLLLEEDDQQRFGADWKLGSKTPLPIEQRQYRVEEAMATFVIQSSVSFAVVENDYFVKLIHAANPDICVPSRQTICRRILDLYKNLKSKMESFLAL